MVIHIVLLGIAVLVAVLQKLGRLPAGFLQFPRKRLFYLVLLGGNLLGFLLTVSQNRDLALGAGAAFEKPAYGSGYYEEQLEVRAGDGRQARFSLEIPQQEGEPETEDVPEPAPDFQEMVQEEIFRLNQERQDKEKYYLPDSFQGTALSWNRQRDNSGSFLALIALGTAVFLPLAAGQEVRKKEQKRREQMILDYPGLVMKLTLFLEAGMSARKAFQRTALDYRKKKPLTGERYAYEELLLSAHEMDNGVAEGEAYHRFGQRCGEVRYKTLATLLVQNLKKGNRELVQMLEQESVQAWEDRKRRARMQGEAAATRLLVPMMLMLLIVIGILMVPAFLSFYS